MWQFRYVILSIEFFYRKIQNQQSTGKTGDVEGSSGSARLLFPEDSWDQELVKDPALRELVKIWIHFLETIN